MFLFVGATAPTPRLGGIAPPKPLQLNSRPYKFFGLPSDGRVLDNPIKEAFLHPNPLSSSMRGLKRYIID